MSMSGDDKEAVGPVLTPGPLAEAVIAAIRAANAMVTVVDRGAYLRVLVPRRCRLEVARVEALIHGPFHLPGDLEGIMPSFRGRLHLTTGEAVWELARRSGT
jgi:toluene monooxygenase system protein D